MRQVWHGQRLQPDAAGASQLHQEQPVATEDRIGDAADHGDVERDAFLEHPDMARMYQQRLAGAELMGDNLAAQFHPGLSVAGQALQDEASPPKMPPPSERCRAMPSSMPCMPHRKP